jgi:hypothetical protein
MTHGSGRNTTAGGQLPSSWLVWWLYRWSTVSKGYTTWTGKSHGTIDSWPTYVFGIWQLWIWSMKNHETSECDLSPSQTLGPFQDGELSSNEGVPSAPSTTWAFYLPLWLPHLQHPSVLFTKTVLSTTSLWWITIVSLMCPLVFPEDHFKQSWFCDTDNNPTIYRGIRAEWVATAMTPWLYATATKRNFLVYFTGKFPVNPRRDQAPHVSIYKLMYDVEPR